MPCRSVPGRGGVGIPACLAGQSQRGGLQFLGVSIFGGSPIWGVSNFSVGGGYGQRSAGTHPTGMHSCFYSVSSHFIQIAHRKHKHIHLHFQFHFILNVAVGGTNGFIPDDCINGGAPKPWSNSDGWSEAMKKFYDDRTNWLTTWNGEDATLQVDYIRVYQFVGEDGRYFCHEVICRNQPKCPIKTSADSEQFHLTLTLMCIWNIRPDTQTSYRYCPVAAQIDHLSKYLKEWMGFINLNFKECNFPRISSSCHKLRSESSTSVLSETFWRNGSIHLECRASVHNTISIQHGAEWWTLLAD